MLGMFSPYDYTWTTSGPAFIMLGTFTACFLSVVGLVYLTYPDMPVYPREFEGGLERELGGPGATRVSCYLSSPVVPGVSFDILTRLDYKARKPGDPDP